MKKQILAVSLVMLLLTACGGNNTATETTTSETTVAETSSVEATEPSEISVETLRDDLKSKYDITAPSHIVNDTLNKGFLERVSNSTPPYEYACDYAKAYINDGEIHFIVNYSLKTTTKITVANGIVTVSTYEYVDDEEHDVDVIPSGMKLKDQYFDMATGEEFVVAVDDNAGEADAGDLVAKVTDVIDESVGKGEEITNVSLEGKSLIITVDVSGADGILPPREIALSRIASITDEILKLDDSYYNAWDTVTLDFGEVGTATLTKSMVKDQGYGKFFDFTDDVLK